MEGAADLGAATLWYHHVAAPHHAGVICSSSNDTLGLYPGGAGAFTAYIPVAELLKSPPVIHSRFLFYS